MGKKRKPKLITIEIDALTYDTFKARCHGYHVRPERMAAAVLVGFLGRTQTPRGLSLVEGRQRAVLDAGLRD